MNRPPQQAQLKCTRLIAVGISLRAWETYIQNADARMQARLFAREPCLWTDEASERSRHLRRGQILVAPIAGEGALPVPEGLIHNWLRPAFIPRATLKNVLAVLHD